MFIRNTSKTAVVGTPLQPKNLFPPPQTPTSRMQSRFTPVTPSTPDFTLSTVSPAWSAATSDVSVTSLQSSLTPSFDQLSLSRGRGHPRKTLQPPSYDDYPVNAPNAEQEWGLHQKAMEQWQYNKLMSESAQAYGEAENQCCYWYYHEKKKKIATSAMQSKPPDDDEMFQEELEKKQQKEDTKKEKDHLR